MDSIDLCEAHALQPFVRCLESRGVSTERYLERQHLSPRLVAEGRGHFIKRQAWEFFDDVTRREGIGSLGFLDGDAFGAADLGSLGDILGRAVTLKDALDTFARLVPTFAEGNQVWLEHDARSQRTWLCCHTERLDPQAFVPDDYTVLVLTGLVRLVAETDWRPLALRFQTALSECRKTSAEFAGVESWYGQRGSGIAFPSEFLARPIAERKDETAATQQSPPEASAQRSPGESLALVLRTMLPVQSLPTSQQAAEIIGVSRRTLFRRLESEGMNYRQLMDRVRFDRARELLSDTSLAVHDVARESGYSSANNFIRAFRRLAATTPGEYRQRENSSTRRD